MLRRHHCGHTCFSQVEELAESVVENKPHCVEATTLLSLHFIQSLLDKQYRQATQGRTKALSSGLIPF